MENDRYLIYELMDRQLHFILPPRFGKDDVVGTAVDVYRNVNNNKVEIELTNNRKYIFAEPDSIVRSGPESITFIYGSADDATDAEFFEEFENLTRQGFGANAVFKSLDRECSVIVFHMSDPPRQYTAGQKRKKRR